MGKHSLAEPVQEIATKSIEKNITHLFSGSYLAAGQHQFHSLWTRDFAFSIRGLLLSGHSDVVRSHLTALLKQKRTEDSLVPRVIDSIPPRWRVMASLYFKLLGSEDNIPLKDPVNAEYVDEHGTEAIDSNALVLLGAYDYYKATGDQKWWDENKDALVQVFHYYDKKIDPKTGLIPQGNFADWQDSVERNGTAFYTNLLYTLVLKEFTEFPEFEIEPSAWYQQKAIVNIAFYDSASGLYRSLVGEPYFSLDANLLAIDRGFFFNDPQNAEKLYENLKRSEFWQRTGTPGFNTFPDYPKSWRSDAVKIVKLGHYHDELVWSWLMAYSAKVAWDLGDRAESERIFGRLSKMIERDKTVGEIYKNSGDNPMWESFLFRSERPFSWGAGAVLEYIHDRKTSN